MLYRKTLLLLLFFLTSLSAFSATFVVTSNADSGLGTLREALTLAAANGSATQDIISFNIADVSEAGRTITLITNLPAVTANLVIDGSTQPGIKFGLSYALVKIINTYEGSAPEYVFTFKGTNIGDFTMNNVWLVSTYYYYMSESIINLNNCGNVNVNHCLIQGGTILINDANSVSFKSNFLGYLADGFTGYQSSLTVYNALNVNVGGDLSEGNLMSGSLKLYKTQLRTDWNYLIKNNKIGADYSGTKSSPNLYSNYGRIIIESGNYVLPIVGVMHGIISDNLIVNFSSVGIVVTGTGDVDIKGNCINTDQTGKINFQQFEPDYVKGGYSIAPTGIVLQDGVNAIVGGSNTGEANILGYLSNGILEQAANQAIITQNSIFCIGTNFNIHDFLAFPKELPTVKINVITNDNITGTSTPNARVELFSNNEGDCPTCDPKHFFAFVMADNQGNWTYSGVVPSNIVASAIYNNQTSKFTKAQIDIQNIKITQPKCGENTGKIEGIAFYNAGNIQWIDQNGNVIAHTANIGDLSPGKYKFKIGSGICGAESGWYEIIDPSPKIDNSKVSVTHPSCNVSGGIKGLITSIATGEILKYLWTDETGKIASTTLNATNLAAGNYLLTVTGATNSCTATYGPITLTNTTGPNIDQTAQNITGSNCGTSTGAITNITPTGTGTLSYAWKNALLQTVATTKDLLNQPAGKYTLQVTDQSACGTVVSAEITIPELNGISMDETQALKNPATCGNANGSIMGIKVSGATLYQWYDSANKLIATDNDLSNALPGIYHLIASNATCSKQSADYTVGNNMGETYSTTKTTVNATCGLNNGSILANFTNGTPISVRWVNAAGQTVGNNLLLSGVDAGTYQLYATNPTGCEVYVISYSTGRIPVLQFDPTSATVNNDDCNLETGSITGAKPTGGQTPYTYTWLNSNNKIVATTANLTKVGTGTYTLTITDAINCSIISNTYSVGNNTNVIAAPTVKNVQLCGPGSALISISNYSAAYKYRLYNTADAVTPITEQTSGTFKVSVKNNSEFYVSQLQGSCESNKVPVKITVGLTALNIKNAFSPNGDGINDTWKIAGMENYPNAKVQVFNRNGQVIFESTGYNTPFNGYVNGKSLPAGVYYYMINLNTQCDIISGALTIVK